VESSCVSIDYCIPTSLLDNLLVPIHDIKLHEKVGEEGIWPSLSQIAAKVLMADGGRGRGRGKAGGAKGTQWRNPPQQMPQQMPQFFGAPPPAGQFGSFPPFG
jgi:hypothetical protein